MSILTSTKRVPIDRLILIGVMAFVVPTLLHSAYKQFHSIQRKSRLRKMASDRLDIALEDSFPASDPSTLGGHIVGPLH